MFNKYKKRLIRCKKSRSLYKIKNKICLVVYRTSRHIYAQIIKYDNYISRVLLSASTLEKKYFDKKYTGNKISACIVGKNIAKRAVSRGITNIIFDRSGYKYHGRIKCLAEYARKYGLLF